MNSNNNANVADYESDEDATTNTAQSPVIAACAKANLIPQSNKKQKIGNGGIDLLGDAVDRESLSEPQSPNMTSMDRYIGITARTPEISPNQESNLIPHSNKKHTTVNCEIDMHDTMLKGKKAQNDKKKDTRFLNFRQRRVEGSN